MRERSFRERSLTNYSALRSNETQNFLKVLLCNTFKKFCVRDLALYDLELTIEQVHTCRNGQTHYQIYSHNN
jgi:hypothetical protein